LTRNEEDDDKQTVLAGTHGTLRSASHSSGYQSSVGLRTGHSVSRRPERGKTHDPSVERFETGDEYFPCSGFPGQGRWMIYGMELPDSILKKVYHKNAEKIFAMYRRENR
jgi:hypothetical protein